MTSHVAIRMQLDRRCGDILGWTRHHLRVLTLVAGGVAATQRMDAQSPAHADAEWRWNGVLRRGDTIEIRLVRGSLRAETDSGTETVVALVRRGEHSEPASTRLTVDASSTRVRIEDRYPAVNAINLGHECVSPTDARGDFWHSDVRLDAVVRVPAGVRLVVHVMDGDVDVRSLTGPRDVRTNQGAVRGEAHVP